MKTVRSLSSLHPFGWCGVLFLVSTQSWGQEGFCTNGNCENGYGTYLFADKTTYVGQFRDGKQHGQGTFYTNGGKYFGEWRDNQPNGQGTLTYANGDQYFGEWRDGQRTQGTMTKADGSVQGGLWANDVSQEELEMQVLETRKTSCTGFGFTPDSDAHAQCVMQLFIAEEAQATSSADAARTQATIRVQQAAQAAALQEAEDYARRQRESEALIRMGESISRGCGAFGC